MAEAALTSEAGCVPQAAESSNAAERSNAAKRIDNFLLAHSQSKLPAHLAHLQSVKWTKATGNNGLPYLYGTEDNTKIGNPEPQIMAADNPLPTYVNIYWEVHKASWGDPTYKTAETDAQAIGLKDYVITDQGWLMPYELDFHNTSSWFFRFKNITGDFWDIWTVWNGHHYILYYSDSPTLRYVTNQQA